MLQTLSPTQLWVLVLAVTCRPGTYPTGVLCYTTSTIQGDVEFVGTTENGQCSYPSASVGQFRCWPSLWRTLRNQSSQLPFTTRIPCYDNNRQFTGEVIPCTMQGRRYFCEVTLHRRDEVIFVDLKLESPNGGIAGFKNLRGNDRDMAGRDSWYPTAYLHRSSNLDVTQRSKRFEVTVSCPSHRNNQGCTVRNVHLLVVKNRCL